ncbi:MAG TPA: cytochrome c biogenesis protein ResB, partial [Chloroflexia bacterium]|nr:cytochrome c biogenesis protein ResB [Chloroflexia bacterium]
QVSPGLRDFPQDYADFLGRAQARFGDLAAPMDAVGLFDLYNSFWFRLLIILICYSIVVCTLNRWGPTLRLINPQTVRTTDTFLLGLSERAQFSRVPLPPAAAADAVAAALRRSRYRVLRDDTTETYYLYADRDRWSKMVTFGSHAALVLLIITAAGLTQVGWREQSVFFAPNTPVAMGHGTDFTVRQNNFRIQYFPGSTDVQEYWCDLTITKNGQDVVHKTIRVNDPLRYENINFFLVQYQPVAHVAALDLAGAPVAMNKMGEAGPITTTAELALEPMLLSFQMQDDDRLPMDLVQVKRPGKETITLQVSNYTSTPRGDDENPALFVRAFKGKDFANLLYNDFIPRQGPLVLPDVPDVRFTFAKETATIMEVAEDYGLTPIAFWFVIMTTGFALSMYITFVRCWARIMPVPGEPGYCDVLLGGLAEKNKVTFETQFEKLALRARDHLVRAAVGAGVAPEADTAPVAVARPTGMES